MIGNDVIDIKQTRLESNWKRKGLLEKLFTNEEQRLIATSTDPEITLWLLWSMKEAAYKIYHRQTKIRQYIPTKLVCSLDLINSDQATGQVFCNGNIYYTKTMLSDGCIHSIAITSSSQFSQVIEMDRNGILKDIHGIPYRIIANQIERQAVSISHHGCYEKIVTLNNADL